MKNPCPRRAGFFSGRLLGQELSILSFSGGDTEKKLKITPDF
jgi:hypothetical protein